MGRDVEVVEGLGAATGCDGSVVVERLSILACMVAGMPTLWVDMVD